MLKSLFFIPISIYLLGVGRNDINILANQYKDEVKVDKYSNKAHKIYKTDKLSAFTIEPFYYSVKDLKNNIPLTVSFKKVPRKDYSFVFTTYDENDEVIERLYEKHNTNAINFNKYYTFSEKTKNYVGEVTFIFTISYYSDLWTVAKFQFMPCGDVLTWDNPSTICRYEVNCRPNEGVSEVFGDYYEVKNLKEVFEIPTFLRFNLNDLKIRVYTQMISYGYLRGQTIMNIPQPKNLSSLDEEKQKLWEPYKLLSSRKLSWEDNTGVGFNIINTREYYVEYGSNHVSLKYIEGYEPTTDFCIPREFYDEYKESTRTINLGDFGAAGVSLSIVLNIKFTEYISNNVFDVVGEIGKGEIDDVIDEEELGSVTIV